MRTTNQINEMQPMSALVSRAQSTTRFCLTTYVIMAIVFFVIAAVSLYLQARRAAALAPTAALRES